MQPNAQISLYKKELRKRMLAKRRALSVIYINNNREVFLKQIKSLKQYEKAQKILVFLSANGEPDLDDFIQDSLDCGRNIYVPLCIDDKHMIAGRMKSFQDLKIGMYGIRTLHYPCEVIDASKIDLVLIPAVACDESGNRLGMGCGYYDRFLSSVSVEKRVAVLWDFQVVDEIPVEVFDKKVSKIITEKRKLL